MKRGLQLFTIAALLLLMVTAAFAQVAQVGVLAGTVKDQTGAVLPGVTIEAKHEQKGLTRTAVTDAEGRFRMAQMSPGPYTVSGSLAGFDTAVVRGNVVESEKTTEVGMTMRLGAATDVIEVTGDVPVVDRTNVAVQTRVRSEEFQKLPVGRSYQSLMGAAPGVIGTGNVNSHGALSSNNQFLFDGADTTDPTTGTFGGNLNFEAIQEVAMYTAGVSAEYGRAVGATVNVITKSGGNDFSGSAKFIRTNDEWNEQNTTKNEVTGASLSRTKFDHVNPVDSFTLGGPIWRDHVWFFGAYEKAETVSAQRNVLDVPDPYQQTLSSPFWNGRVTAQLGANHNVWVKRHESPTNGFVIDYTGAAGDLFALTRQDQTAEATTAQWTGVFGSKFSAEAIWAKSDILITVFPFLVSPLTNGAPHFSQANGHYFNGGSFDGIVDRPREQLVGALSIFQPMLGTTHDIKVGFDRQEMESGAQFAWPGNQLYIDASFNPTARTFVPAARRDYDEALASVSTGTMQALYVRDKFDLFKRLFVEAGLRYEAQDSESDAAVPTVDYSTISPRLSASYDLAGTGKTLLLGSYGRFYQFVIQGLSDSFAQNPQRGKWTNFSWNGTAYVPTGRTELSGSSIQPNRDLKPTYTDEFTIGFQQQIGNTIGVGIRGIWREWGDLIDDIYQFNADRTIFQQFVNYEGAERKYRGVELTFEKRFSKRWNANASYTWSKAEGNHFGNYATVLADHLNTNCRTAVDVTIGTNGTIPCSEVTTSSRLSGDASYDRPHNLKGTAAYVFSLGPVNVTAGFGGEYISGVNYTPVRSMSVLYPGTTTASTESYSYLYEERGSRRLPSYYTIDGSLETAWRIWRTVEVGLKGEAFNLLNAEDKVGVSNTAFCANAAAAAGSTCAVARTNFGTATTRGAFLTPRTYRITGLIRF